MDKMDLITVMGKRSKWWPEITFKNSWRWFVRQSALRGDMYGCPTVDTHTHKTT